MTHDATIRGWRRGAGATFALVLAGCASQVPPAAAPPPPPTTLEAVGELRPGSGYARGYFPREALPRSDRFLPKAPDPVPPGSTDELRARAAFASAGSPRWRQAARDAELKFPQAAGHFACALGVQPSPAATPHLVMLLRRTLVDAGLATYGAKDRYARPRPFVTMGQPSCTPQEEPMLSRDGAYPSGHASLGWAWALVLADLAPDRRDALLRRGYAYGQSRVACGVHWQSDVDAGRVVGAAVALALQSEPVFRAQADLARREIAALVAAGRDLPSAQACEAEAAALADF